MLLGLKRLSFPDAFFFPKSGPRWFPNGQINLGLTMARTVKEIFSLRHNFVSQLRKISSDRHKKGTLQRSDDSRELVPCPTFKMQRDKFSDFLLFLYVEKGSFSFSDLL